MRWPQLVAAISLALLFPLIRSTVHADDQQPHQELASQVIELADKVYCSDLDPKSTKPLLSDLQQQVTGTALQTNQCIKDFCLLVAKTYALRTGNLEAEKLTVQTRNDRDSHRVEIAGKMVEAGPVVATEVKASYERDMEQFRQTTQIDRIKMQAPVEQLQVYLSHLHVAYALLLQDMKTSGGKRTFAQELFFGKWRHKDGHRQAQFDYELKPDLSVTVRYTPDDPKNVRNRRLYERDGVRWSLDKNHIRIEVPKQKSVILGVIGLPLPYVAYIDSDVAYVNNQQMVLDRKEDNKLQKHQ